MINICLNQVPVSWKASQVSGKRHYNPRHLEKIRTQKAIKIQYKEKPLTEYVSLIFSFFMPIPKSTSKKKKELMLNGQIYPTKLDVTNCQKFYEDCLKGIVIEDDRTVCFIIASKYFSEEPKVLITVIPWRHAA